VAAWQFRRPRADLPQAPARQPVSLQLLARRIPRNTRMPLLDWTQALDLGVPAMDAEHKELIAAMNRVHELDGRGADQATIGAAIDRLVALTRRHFADEEKHMEAIGFPDRKRHALIHKDMLERVGRHCAEFAQGNGRVDPKFFEFLVFWLGAHIKGIDRRYADHRTPAKV